MKKASTTNKNIIILGSLLVIMVVVTIFLVDRKSSLRYEMSRNNFMPLEGAIANTYEAPEEILDLKDNDTIIGDEKAELKVLVYEDYSSSYSADLAKTLDLLMTEYKDDLAIITRPFIASNSIESQESALNYLCAQEFDKGEEMRNLLLQQSERENNYLAYAEELKINKESFLSCLTNEEKLVKLEELKKEAKDNLVLGAPTMLVGNEMLIGARPYADFVDSNGDAIEGLKTVIKRYMEDKS